MSFFRDIYDLFFGLALRCYSMSDDLAEWPWPFHHLSRPVERIGEGFHALGDAFTEVWRWSRDLRDDLEYLFDVIAGYVASIPQWLLDKLNQAYQLAQDAWNKAIEAWAWAKSIADIIGTTFEQIVAFIKEHAETIYQTINEYITNVYETIYETVNNYYETVKNYITNVYETINEYTTNVYETITNVFNTYVTNIIGVTEDIVRSIVASAMASVAAPINLINAWFDDIQDFFNDPAGFYIKKLDKLGARFADDLWSVIEKVLEKVW